MAYGKGGGGGRKQYDNTNKGVLFVNDDKKSDKHPDFRGSININGVEYWLSGWKKESAKGKLLSLAVTPKEAGAEAGAEHEPRQAPKASGPAKAAPKSDDAPW